MIKIFVAAPISAFNDRTRYMDSRKNLLKIINLLQADYTVYSEVINISKIDDYDDPSNSVKKDFMEIDASSVFILYHPQKIQSSTLIELGYAVAKGKTIIIISEYINLPYMALGLPQYSRQIYIINSPELNKSTYVRIKNIIDELDLK